MLVTKVLTIDLSIFRLWPENYSSIEKEHGFPSSRHRHTQLQHIVKSNNSVPTTAIQVLNIQNTFTRFMPRNKTSFCSEGIQIATK